MNFKSTSLSIFLFIIFFSKNLFADPFSQFEKNVNDAILQFNKDILNLPKSDDVIVQSIDKIIKKMSEGLEFTQKALDDNDVTTTLSVLELIDTTIIETSATIPSENKSNMNEINLEEIFSEEQLENLSKISENKIDKQNQETTKLISNIKNLEDKGFKASNYVNEIGTTIQSFHSSAGGFVQYTILNRVNENYVLASPNLNQTLLPGGVYDCTKHSMVGCVVGPKLVFVPTGSFTEEPRGPLEFWETEEYRDDFYEAYDRVKWPWLHKENPLSEEEFKEMFPKWPDGVDYSSGYDWAKFEYDGPPIDWPGLNPDGTCEGRRLVCQEQVEYNLHKLKNEPNIVNYDEVLKGNNNIMINSDDINLNNVLLGETGPDIDSSIITNNQIDTSAFTSEVNKINETVAQVTGNISTTTDSIDSFMEQVDNINESVAQINESVSQVTENINETVADISDSIDTESISSGLEAFSNSNDLIESLDAVQDTMDRMAETTEQIKQDLLNQDLDDYFENATKGQPCAMSLNMQTLKYTPVYDC